MQTRCARCAVWAGSSCAIMRRMGLLKPVPGNDANHYRYYTREYLCAVVADKTLRNIDMPLTEMEDIIYGHNVEAVRISIQKQMTASCKAPV